MKKEKKILTFIGARGGSKGLKDKNILLFAGKPLIAWSIESSLSSKHISKTIVSTDSEVIAKVALEYGATVPFMRPSELATDTSNIYDAIRHSLHALNAQGESFDYIVLLQPTQPLRPNGFLDSVIDYYFSNQKSDLDSLISVKEIDPKYNLLMELTNENYLRYLNFSNPNVVNRQDLKKLYLVSGVIYIAPVKKILSGDRFDFGNVLHFVTDDLVSSDIDTKEDFDQALINYNILKSQGRL
ncbi:MAG: acylneuraminate cytidylyltransferase family protein [Leptospira sp.]|nr:acylneuraminate cytidylyltransferase family protein [Leptospira sp.]